MVQIRVSPTFFPANIQLCSGRQKIAPGEARTHGLQIMRLTRCLLRYGGSPLHGEFHSVTLLPTTWDRWQKFVRCGIRTHALNRGPEISCAPYQGTRHSLESGALDHSANLTAWLCVHKSRFTPGQKQNLSRARLELATFCV